MAEFGYTRADYDALTPRQIAFIRKAWEDREVRQTNLMNMAINNAIANSHRRKGRPPIPLWKKQERVDVGKAKDDIRVIEKMEKRDGKGWIEKLWKANRKQR